MYRLAFGDFRQHHIYSEQFARAHVRNEADYCLYVVREGDLALYVGQVGPSQVHESGLIKIHRRLMQHYFAGQHPENEERIGCLLWAGRPESDALIIELWTAADAVRVVGDVSPHLKLADIIDELERRVIRLCRPCLNVKDNPVPNRLSSPWRQRYSDCGCPQVPRLGESGRRVAGPLQVCKHCGKRIRAADMDHHVAFTHPSVLASTARPASLPEPAPKGVPAGQAALPPGAKACPHCGEAFAARELGQHIRDAHFKSQTERAGP